MNHGHVTPNPDGSVARCGGPAICSVCALEKIAFDADKKPLAVNGNLGPPAVLPDVEEDENETPHVDQVIGGLQILKKYGEVMLGGMSDWIWASVSPDVTISSQDEADLNKLGWSEDQEYGGWHNFG